MKKFKFRYSVDGVMTMLPLYVMVEAETKDEALVKAHEKVEADNMFVNIGYTYHIYS